MPTQRSEFRHQVRIPQPIKYYTTKDGKLHRYAASCRIGLEAQTVHRYTKDGAQTLVNTNPRIRICGCVIQ